MLQQIKHQLLFVEGKGTLIDKEKHFLQTQNTIMSDGTIEFNFE